MKPNLFIIKIHLFRSAMHRHNPLKAFIGHSNRDKNINKTKPGTFVAYKYKCTGEKVVINKRKRVGIGPVLVRHWSGVAPGLNYHRTAVKGINATLHIDDYLY